MDQQDLTKQYLKHRFCCYLSGADVEILIRGLRQLALGEAEDTNNTLKTQVNTQWNEEIGKLRKKMEDEAKAQQAKVDAEKKAAEEKKAKDVKAGKEVAAKSNGAERPKANRKTRRAKSKLEQKEAAP